MSPKNLFNYHILTIYHNWDRWHMITLDRKNFTVIHYS